MAPERTSAIPPQTATIKAAENTLFIPSIEEVRDTLTPLIQRVVALEHLAAQTLGQITTLQGEVNDLQRRLAQSEGMVGHLMAQQHLASQHAARTQA